MSCENLRTNIRSEWKFQVILSYIRTQDLLILEPIGQSVFARLGPKEGQNGKYYPIGMKLSGYRYLLLYEKKSAIDFGADRSIPLVGHRPKVEHYENIIRPGWNSGCIPLYEYTSAIDFEADRSAVFAGHGPKVRHHRNITQSEWNFQGIFSYIRTRTPFILEPIPLVGHGPKLGHYQHIRSGWNFQGTFYYMRTRVSLIFEPIGQYVSTGHGLKLGHNGKYYPIWMKHSGYLHS